MKEDMPLSFTVKIDFDKIILTTKKKLPIPLNDKFTVFLNDRKIYLPSDKQINSYKELYYKLKNHGKIEYPKNEDYISELFNLLANISKDIMLGEGVKKLCRNYYKVKLFFKNENNNIKCKVTINYFGKIINILDKNIDYFLRDNNFEEEISMKLERYGFIKRENEFLFIGNDEEYYDFLTNGLKFFERFSILEFSNSFNKINLIDSNYIDAVFEEKDEQLKFKYNIDGLEYSEYINVLQALEDNRDFYKTKNGRLLNLRDLGIANLFNIIDNLICNQEIYDGEIEVDKSKAIFIDNNIENYNLNFIRGSENLKVVSKRLQNRAIEEVNILNYQ